MLHALLTVFLGASQADMKDWLTDYAQALQEAQRTGRALVIDFDSDN